MPKLPTTWKNTPTKRTVPTGSRLLQVIAAISSAATMDAAEGPQCKAFERKTSRSSVKRIAVNGSLTKKTIA
jgi:hypothetical protein